MLRFFGEVNTINILVVLQSAKKSFIVIKKVANIIVIFVLMIPTSGIIVNKHYSNGNLYSASLFFKAKSCCEDDVCCHGSNNGCSEETEAYRLVVDFDCSDPVQIDHSENAQVLFAITFADLVRVFSESNLTQNFLFYIDPPPLLADIPVANCSFLL